MRGKEYLTQFVDRPPHSIMYMKIAGAASQPQCFYKLVTLLEISVDQFFFPNELKGESNCRKQIDDMLNLMDEKN